MNAGQYEGIVGRLDAILAKMPAAPIADAKPLTVHHLDGTSTVSPAPVRTGWPYERPGPAPVPSISRDLDGTVTLTTPMKGSALANVQRHALGAVLQALDGWVQGAKENHEAMGHRHENTGSECWRTFAPSDLRNMINDAATELGLATFAAPTDPEEDKAL